MASGKHYIVLRYICNPAISSKTVDPAGPVATLPGSRMAAKPHPITKADYEMLAEFRRGLRQFLHFSEVAARAAGLAPQQHQALLAIKGFPGSDRLLIGELAERLQIRPQSAVGLADRLVAKGYARRFPDGVDRRRVRLGLTSRGEAVLERLSATHREQLRALSPRFEQLLRHLSPPPEGR